MDLSSSAKRRNRPRGRGVKIEGGQYEKQLQLYIYPPTSDVTLEEFETLATDRQKLLKEISYLKEKQSHGDMDREVFRSDLKEKMKQFPLNNEEHRRRDHISHYILRLAYCRSEELRRWFLVQEVELLRSRLLNASIVELKELIHDHKLYIPLEIITIKRSSVMVDSTVEEKTISEEMARLFPTSESERECYKAHFTLALDLIHRRNAVVKNGYVYFPSDSRDILISIVCNKFRSLLSKDLAKTATYVNSIDEDERIAPLLLKLKNEYMGNDFSDSASKLGENIRLNEIDAFAKESFPPCMRHLHESLRKDHHLKHFGRLQYGLFLKSIGLSLESALTFWREEFTKKIEFDKFEKNYAYHIRHSFGKEGKRANYSAYSCVKIITNNGPSTGDHHGCPFRHWDVTHIQEKMISYGIPIKQVSQIVDYSQSSHYQLACQKYYETVHGLQQAGFSLELPNQYYYESRNIRGGTAGTIKKKKNRESIGMEGSNTEDESTLTEMNPFDEATFAEITTLDMEIN